MVMQLTVNQPIISSSLIRGAIFVPWWYNVITLGCYPR